MANKIPVINWIERHSPRREPKFHHKEILLGAGKSIKVLLTIFSSGWYFRKLIMINVRLVKGLGNV